MNKPAIPIIIATSLLAGVLIGAIVLPRFLVDVISRQATQSDRSSTARQSGPDPDHQTAPTDGTPTTTGVPGAGRESPGAAPTIPTAAPVVENRAAFSITLPAGSTVDPNDGTDGDEQRLAVNVPGHGVILIVVAHDKVQAAATYDGTLAGLRRSISRAEEQKPEAFGSLRLVRATAMKGIVKGLEFRYEIGQYEGWDKECILVAEYAEEDKREMAPKIRSAFDTFRMKQ